MSSVQHVGDVHVQEVCSFLKGSSEAMDSPDGKLSLDSYLEVGRKRAPNFTADTRREVYPIFAKYEREKLRLNRCVSHFPLCTSAQNVAPAGVPTNWPFMLQVTQWNAMLGMLSLCLTCV